jgi:hypothetical protein
MNKVYCKMSSSVSGELCNGIAYIDWARLHSSRPGSDGPLMQCIGKHRLFEVRSFSQSDINQTFASDDGGKQVHEVTAKYVRSFGSTAVLLSPPDSTGRQTARAQTLGPWERKAVEVGPFEERILEFIKKTRSEGIEKTMVEPAQLLGRRSWLVASRSADMFTSAVVPVREFLSKMRTRVPELVRESYAIATSIKIEIKFDDMDDNDKPQP